jgi:hypothetical protein
MVARLASIAAPTTIRRILFFGVSSVPQIGQTIIGIASHGSRYPGQQCYICQRRDLFDAPTWPIGGGDHPGAVRSAS